MVVRTIIRHIPSGTEVESDFPLTDLSTPQKIGSSQTYARRYNLLGLLNIAAVDDDGNTASNIPNPSQWVGPDPAGLQRGEPQAMPPGPAMPQNWL
jgi:hypothetical protein